MSPLSRTEVHGHPALIIENGLVRAIVIPDLGGRIWDVVDVIRDVNWIWHRPGVPLVRCELGAEYDSAWAGGWEELFPNDAPGEFEGRLLPDHGEWWTREWAVDEVREGESPMIRLSSRMNVCRASCFKEISMRPGSARLDIRYTIVSEQPEPFHFLFKQHLPVAVTSSCRIELPGGQVTAVDPSFSDIVAQDGPSPWPLGAQTVAGIPDLSHVRGKESRLKEFVYVASLPSPSCAIVDTARACRIRLSWEHATMPYLWLFMSYGGWRDVYTVVLEPCTNMPKDLTSAKDLGQAALLRPGERFETYVSVEVGGIAER